MFQNSSKKKCYYGVKQSTVQCHCEPCKGEAIYNFQFYLKLLVVDRFGLADLAMTSRLMTGRMPGDNGNSIAMEIEIPPECCVIFYNDDCTTKEFVVQVLESVFGKEEQEAVFLTEKIHNEGVAIVGVYTYDIAATRAALSMARAKKQGFPLRIEVRK